MGDLLNNPAVQGGLAPFAVALVVTFALFAVRLGGLAIAAALGTAVYMIGGFAFPPVSAQQKILLVALAVPALGIVVDLAFKPTRVAGPVLGLLFGVVVLWVGVNVLKQKEMLAMLLAGGGVFALVAWLVGAMFALRDDPVRAGAAALTLGLGVGVSAVLSASGSYGQYGASVGAGAGAFLLVQMLLGRTIQAGATFALSAGVACGLIVAGALLGTWQGRPDEPPYLVPQEFGLRTDCRWFEFIDEVAGRVLRLDVLAPRALHVSATHFTADDLYRARTETELRPRAELVVHADVAHRGLGTASCGPDALPQYRLQPDTYRFSYRLALFAAV